MPQPNSTIVPPNLLKQIVMSLGGGLLMAGGLFFLLGLRTIWYILAAAIGVLMVVTFVIAALRQRPRVVIGPEGFRVEKIFGEEAHTWDDVAGPFVIIKFGLSKAVGYNFSEAYNARVGKTPTTKFSGHNAVIMGAFQATAEELAELLNRHRREYQSK